MNNSNELSQSVDIWFLGCLIIKMANKSDPWSNISKNTEEVIKLIKESTVPPKFPNELSIEGKEFLKVCLKKDPEKRLTTKELLKHPWLTAEPRNSKGEIKDNNYSSLRKDSKDKTEYNIKRENIIVQVKLKNNAVEKKNVLTNILKEEDEGCGDFSVSLDDSSSSISIKNDRINESHEESKHFNDIINQREITHNSILSNDRLVNNEYKDKIVAKQQNYNSLINNKTKITVFNNEEESFMHSDDEFVNSSNKSNNVIKNNLLKSKDKITKDELTTKNMINSIEDDIEFSNI